MRASELAGSRPRCYRRVVEPSPEKAPELKGPTGPEANRAPAEIPPNNPVKLLDLDLESSPAASDANLAPAPDSAAPLPPTEPAPTQALSADPVSVPVGTSTPGTNTDSSVAGGPKVSAAEPSPSPVSPAGPASSAARLPIEESNDATPSPTPAVAGGSPSRPAEARAPRTPRSAGVQPRLSVSPMPALDPLDSMPALRSSRALPGSDHQRTGHPVRDRLLAKAAESSKPPQEPTSDANSGAFSALRGMEAELEQLAGPRQRLVSEPMRVGKAVLSPTATLVGVTIIGLALITSLFLLLVKFAPRNPTDIPAPVVVGATPTAAFAPHPEATALINLPPPVAPPERKREAGPWRIGAAENGQRLIRGTVGSNPFLRAIEEAGIAKNQAYRVYGALKSHKDLDHCRPKDEFIALVNRADKRVVAFEYVVSKEEVYQAREQDGKLVGKQLDLKVNKHRVQGGILIAPGGFAAAAQNAGLEPSIGDVINRALSGHTNVSQFRAGDRLRVVAQEVTVLGEFHRYAGIEALEYVPVEGDPVRIYYHAAKKQYYDAKGRAPGEGGWRSPVRGAPITSKFNPQRMHPILKKKMPHNGTDFGAPTGTPIYAASYGKIAKLGNYGANGNYIAIEHDNGYETGYSHLSRFEPGLKVGDSVKRAQVIGYVGSTGRSTGPHLHFSARKNGAYIDPETLHLDALTVLPAAERAVFQGVKEKYDVLLEAVALPPALPAAPVVTPPPAAPDEDMEGEGPDLDVGSAGASLPAVVAVPPPIPQPVSPGVIPGLPPVQPAPVAPGAGGAFFLTDKELMQNQPAVDDGEVDE